MKLHLPVRLFRAVMAAYMVIVGVGLHLPFAFADAPEGYKQYLIHDNVTFASLVEDDNIENRLYSLYCDIELDAKDQIDGQSAIFSSESSGGPHSMSIISNEEYQGSVISMQDIRFDTLSHLSITNTTNETSCDNYAIAGSYYAGSVTITRVNDNEQGTHDVLFANNDLDNGTYSNGAVISAPIITINGNGDVVFLDNDGTAIKCDGYAEDDPVLPREENYNILKINNNSSFTIAYNEGTAIYCETLSEYIQNSHIKSYTEIKGNEEFSIIHNNGSSIRVNTDLYITENGHVLFEDNATTDAVIYMPSTSRGYSNWHNMSLIINGNESVIFRNNSGSAISQEGIYSTTDIVQNGDVIFEDNEVISTDNVTGGAIGSIKINISNNSSVKFHNNSISSGKKSAYGSAIYVDEYTLNNNLVLSFTDNKTLGDGSGAIFANKCGQIEGNESILFLRNTSKGEHAQGGAITVGYWGSLSIEKNGAVLFEKNEVGASSYDQRYQINNAFGGSIYSRGSLVIANNTSVAFSENIATSLNECATGGAIYKTDSESETLLSVCNNGYVIFEKNLENNYDRECRLRSIYVDGDNINVNISAPKDAKVEFRDSIYIGEGSTVNLNAVYSDREGKSVKQNGSIVFTGKYTVNHLNTMMAYVEAGRQASEMEILNSRTSEVYAMTNLFGGSLCVEDGAIYKGYGITAHEGSESTIRVKDAELSHERYDITLNSGTTLELEGENKITAADLVLNGGSTLRYILDGTESLPAMTLSGNLSLLGAVSLQLDREMDYGVYQLMTCSSISGDISQLAADMPEHYELAWHANALDLIVWEHMQLTIDESNLSFTRGAVKAVAEHDLEYRSVTMDDGLYQISGEGSLGVSGLLSVTGGADLTLDVDTTAMVVEVGDDSSLSLQKRLNLVSLMTLDDEETESAKAISVGRNAELSLTDAALLGQVATADETSAVYYQTETGDKLLKFTGEMGSAGLNLALGEDGKTVSATDSAGFTGNITVLSGTTLVNEATSTTDGVPFGDTYATAADKTITVQGGATLDINGRETYYHLVLEKDALLTNSGTDTHHDWKGIPVIDLSGDAEVNAAAQICMVGANYATNTLNLNGNTLTKTGSANLVLRNTSINEGTLAVNGGLVRFMGNTSTAAGTGIQVNNGGTLWISEGTGNYAGSLVLNTGGHVYLGEGPSGTLGGDYGTDSQTISLTGLGKLELAGGSMTFRGEKLNMGTVDVTAASTLELWDQTGSNGVATTASTISTLNMSANLNLATAWKSSLDIARLTGSGELLVGSSQEKHKVSVQDLSGFTGTFAIRGANSTLSLNLSGDDEMNAARVTKDDSAVLILEGSGTYCFSNLENVDAAATGISDIQFGDTWSGKIALRNSAATGMELDDFGGAGKTIVIEGVSGWFSYNRTVESHLQLVESGLTMLDTSKKTYTYTGGISGSGDFIIKSKADNTYTGTYDLSGDLSAWDGAFRVQQSGDNTNTAPVNLNLTGGGTLFSGTDGCGVLMERTGEMNVTIGNAGTATTMRGDIRNVGVTNEGTTTYGTLNVTLNNTVDAQGDIIASRINVGAGADINFSGTVQANQWTVGDDAHLVVESGSKVYLSEADNGTLRGDVGTDDVGTLNLTRTAGVELAGGTLFYRGKNITFGSVDVTEDSVLEIWDQTGVDGVASHACTIDTLNLNASLEQKTTWKCTLEIGSLTGSGPLTVSSRNEKHYVTLNDLSEYTGTVSISGANTTLTLNMVKDAVVNASLVTKDNTSHLVLKGQGSYNIGTARSLAAGVCFAEDWEGSVRLTGAMAGETLSGLNQESSWVELFGVSGYLSQADAAAGAQTYGMNLKLTDAGETAAWNLNNGWNGDVRTFTGMVCGTGTLNRNHYQGTEQTLIFAGDVSGWSGALEHNATSATNNGQKVKTNVTFNGSSEINVAMRTNGKGELNVTLDDANLAAGSKVTVNNAVSATNFTVTEGTAAKLNNTLQVSGVVELMAAASLELGEVVSLSAGAGSAQLNTVSLNSTGIRGTGDASSLTNLQMQNLSGSFAVADVALHEVEISGSNSALTLSNVRLDDSCTIDLGTAGTVTFDNSTLCLTVPELSWDGSEVLHIDCSALLTGNALGNLLLDVNHSVDEIVNLGYQTVAVDFGANVNTTNLNLNLSQAQFKGFVGSIAQFNLVPEPTTATLSLLALAALAARRRRK